MLRSFLHQLGDFYSFVCPWFSLSGIFRRLYGHSLVELGFKGELPLILVLIETLGDISQRQALLYIQFVEVLDDAVKRLYLCVPLLGYLYACFCIAIYRDALGSDAALDSRASFVFSNFVKRLGLSLYRNQVTLWTYR